MKRKGNFKRPGNAVTMNEQSAQPQVSKGKGKIGNMMVMSSRPGKDFMPSHQRGLFNLVLNSKRRDSRLFENTLI